MSAPWVWHGDRLWGGENERVEVVFATDDGKSYGMHLPLLGMDNPAADKPLIAAAPDMFAALRLVWNSIDRVNHPAAEAVKAALERAS